MSDPRIDELAAAASSHLMARILLPSRGGVRSRAARRKAVSRYNASLRWMNRLANKRGGWVEHATLRTFLLIKSDSHARTLRGRK